MGLVDLIVTTAVGLIVTGVLSFVGKQLFDLIKRVQELAASMVVLNESYQRTMIKVARSHSYAFQELKVNGSAKRALELTNEAEDIITGRDDCNAVVAMGCED